MKKHFGYFIYTNKIIHCAMKKELLIEYVNEKLSIRQIAEKENTSQTNTRYWLKKYGLKTDPITKKINKEGFKLCPKCKIEKERTEFYVRRGKEGQSVYCKRCTNDVAVERQRLFKAKCIEYKGGCCVECGYAKCNAALEFHHTDPTQKDFNISHFKLTTFDDRVKKELDKCILICSNCHREIHNKWLHSSVE